MKGALEDRIGDGESNRDAQITKAIVNAISSNDKVVEIRPAERSKGMGLTRLLLFGAGAVALAYWVQNSQKPDDLIGSVKEKATDQTHQAAEKIEAGSENASERIKDGSESASERIEEGSERAGEAVQEAGETVADRTEEAGEKAAEETDSDASSFSEQ